MIFVLTDLVSRDINLCDSLVLGRGPGLPRYLNWITLDRKPFVSLTEIYMTCDYKLVTFSLGYKRCLIISVMIYSLLNLNGFLKSLVIFLYISSSY